MRRTFIISPFGLDADEAQRAKRSSQPLSLFSLFHQIFFLLFIDPQIPHPARDVLFENNNFYFYEEETRTIFNGFGTIQTHGKLICYMYTLNVVVKCIGASAEKLITEPFSEPVVVWRYSHRVFALQVLPYGKVGASALWVGGWNFDIYARIRRGQSLEYFPMIIRERGTVAGWRRQRIDSDVCVFLMWFSVCFFGFRKPTIDHCCVPRFPNAYGRRTSPSLSYHSFSLSSELRKRCFSLPEFCVGWFQQDVSPNLPLPAPLISHNSTLHVKLHRQCYL